MFTILPMHGERGEPASTINDDAWLKQYYTRARAGTDSLGSLPQLTAQPAGKYGEPQPLGAGAEKEVVQVRDGDTLRDVALARPREGRSAHSFVREARLLARLEHPHIVPVHDLGLDPDGRPYFTMKLLAGETLEAVLARLRQGDAATRSAYPFPVLLDIFTRICEAVAFAHSRGILHRDIKPANVQIGEYGDVRLIDWGLAKDLAEPSDSFEPGAPVKSSPMVATLAGAIKGTPGYMAPEQAAGCGGTADVRTDTYALGALLYALLTWQPPVTGSTTEELLRKTMAGEIVPPRRCAHGRNIPPVLEAVACKALSRRPEDRYATADALLADVHAFTNGYATAAEEAGLFRLLWLVLRRHRTLVAVIIGSLLAIAAVGSAAVLRIRASRDATRTALHNLQEEHALRTRLTRAALPKILAEARAQVRALDFDEALAVARTAIGVDPAQAEAWDLAGWIYLGQEQYGLAAAAFRRDLPMLLERKPHPPGAVTGISTDMTQAVAAAVGRSSAGKKPTDPSASPNHRRVRSAADTAFCNEPGLAAAERAEQLAGSEMRALSVDEFRRLMEQVRAVSTHLAHDCRVALGVYCSRHNPEEWTNTAQVAFVQWAMRGVNDRNTELILQNTSTGLEARVTGAAASDLVPLAGLPLAVLDLHGTAVRDLQSLKGMPLRQLDLSGTAVSSWEPIYGLPLRELRVGGFRKLPADLFARCPTLECVVVSPGTELSRKDAKWPAGVRKVVQ